MIGSLLGWLIDRTAGELIAWFGSLLVGLFELWVRAIVQPNAWPLACLSEMRLWKLWFR